MKILATSDWHVDASTAGFDRGDDISAAVWETVEVAAREKVDLYLFLGDLCDPGTMRSHRAEAVAVRTAAALWFRHRIPSRWLTGNHDVIEDGSGSHTLAGVVGLAHGLHETEHSGYIGVLASPYVEPVLQNFVRASQMIDMIYLPFTPRSHGYDPEDWVRKCGAGSHGRKVIVAAHLNIEGIESGSETAEMPRGRDVFLPLDAIRERWPDALVLNGHYHRRQVYKGVVVPGSLERLTFGEERNQPGFLIVEV
jgi:DNA repair exonuclease SbcCD nuclease subunit